MSALVEMTGIEKRYSKGGLVLSNLDFTARAGEMNVIMGASGCGKSTFLNICGLLDSFNSGQYIFDGKPVHKKKLNSYHRIRARDMGFVFQAYCLIEQLSVRDNILMPFLYNGQKISRNVTEKLDELADDLGISAIMDKKATFLSGGEKQRVAIARAMIKTPKLLIADEPTGNLDEPNAAAVAGALSRAARSGASVIVVTHNSHLSFGGVFIRHRLMGGALHRLAK